MLKTEVTFFYPHSSPLTGQELASSLILELIAEENCRFRTVKLPVFDRSKKWSIIHLFCFLKQIAYVWWRFLVLPFNRRAVVYLNLGQTFKALVCDGLPFFLCSFFKRNIKCVISLHGDFFCTWRARDLRLRLFVRILRRACLITVLGPAQRQRLLELGIPTEQVHIVNNTCERSMLAAEVSAKKKHPVTLLYLSNLIEAKGYKDYLLALLHLSRRENCPARVHATLCGKLTATSLDSSNASSDDEAWIRQTIETINKSRSVDVVWVQGAYGRDKAALFSSTDIFVYPSRVDSQPTVLIEAMATGCAVICSRIGETPTMFGESAVILPRVDVEEIAEAIVYLAGNDEKRTELARASRERFEQYFSREAYAAKWKGIFGELAEDSLRGSPIMLGED